MKLNPADTGLDGSVYQNISVTSHRCASVCPPLPSGSCVCVCLLVCAASVLRVCGPASLGRLHSCITFHLSSLLDRVSAASTFSRAGPGAMPRGQQLMGLRKALYRALRSAFRASRRATCHMLKAYPSPGDGAVSSLVEEPESRQPKDAKNH